MNKIQAITALTNGEVTEITSADGKQKYSMVDGSIVTPRKKALDMKDLMEEGWETKAALDWKDHIGKGILCIAMDDEMGAIVELALGSEGGVAMTYGQEALFDGSRPMTKAEVAEYIWDEAAAEKKLEKDSKKSKDVKKPVEVETTEDVVPEENSTEEEGAGELPEPEVVPIPEPVAPGPDFSKPASGNEKATEPMQSTESTATPKAEAISVEDQLTIFFDLGLDEVDAGEFYTFHALDRFKIDDIRNKGEEEISKYINHYYEEN